MRQEYGVNDVNDAIPGHNIGFDHIGSTDANTVGRINGYRLSIQSVGGCQAHDIRRHDLARYNVVGENGCETVFVKRMQANFHFSVQPSDGPGEATTGTSPGLGGGFYFIVRVSFRLHSLFRTMTHGYKS